MSCLKDKDIIRMANDIAIFHQSFPEEEAVPMLSEHINKFWHPGMRTRLFELFSADSSAFNGLVAKSISGIKCSTHNPIDVVFKDKTGSGG